MLYDAGDFDAAAVRLERLNAERPGIPAVGLQIADISAAAGKPADSQMWLLRTLPLAPTLSWTPYANLALFDMSHGDIAAAGRRLEDGLAFFPRARELRLMQARVDVRTGDVRAAESLLTGLLAERPSDGEAALLLLALQGPEMSPEASRARLWKLFDLVPSDHAVFDALASSLIAARDWEGMQIALRQYQGSGGQADARLLLFQGFAAAMSGDDAGASSAFRRSALLARDGIARFDLALVMLRRGAARGALSELDGAAEEVQERTLPADRPALLSRIETLRGAALLLDADVPGAGSALSRALALDPHNLRAGLLLRKLEAGGQ
jgi:tetratricopeptide (TPR) repeat protein